MHWVQAIAALLGALASWRWIVRPVRRWARAALQLLRDIRASSSGVQTLAMEVRGLAGSVIRLVVAIVEEHQVLRVEHEELKSRLSMQAELLVDLDADVRRLEKSLRRSPDEPD